MNAKRLSTLGNVCPDFVFQRSFARYFAIEHSHIGRKEFGLFLFKMSNIFEDESVNYMTIVPHPVDYYYRHYSFFGLASFNPPSLVERYLPIMSREKDVDSFLYRIMSTFRQLAVFGAWMLQRFQAT